MNINFKTKLDYELGDYFSPDELVKIVSRHEKLVSDTYLDNLYVLVTSASDKQVWYKIGFYLEVPTHERLESAKIEFSLADKNLYFSPDSWSNLHNYLNSDTTPFYNHPVYNLITFLMNSGNEIKYTLIQAIELIKVIEKMVRKQ